MDPAPDPDPLWLEQKLEFMFLDAASPKYGYCWWDAHLAGRMDATGTTGLCSTCILPALLAQEKPQLNVLNGNIS